MVWWVIAWIAGADTCEYYGSAERVAELRDLAVTESSGVAQSRTREGVWFTHNDNNNAAALHAFDLDGNFIESHAVRSAENFDWEDLSAAPCPHGGDCLYIGDIGDNDGVRGGVTVYVVPEPRPGRATRAIERWTGFYEDGLSHDAETLMVHPCTGRVHIVTKSAGQSAVYRFPAFPGADIVELEFVAFAAIDGEVTGGDFDADGDRVVLRTQSQISEWIVDPSRPNDHWGDVPTTVGGAADLQGEAIAYSLDGSLVTTAEGEPMSIGFVPCEHLEPASHACEYPTQCGCNRGGQSLVLLPFLALFRRRP